MTVAKPPHGRKLGLTGVALTKQRNNRNDTKALTLVRDELEKAMVDSGFLNGAPFSWVTVAVRYGLKNDDEPSYQSINRKYGDLPIAIEIDTHEMMDASLEELSLTFKRAVLKALVHAGRKYDCATDFLESMKEAMAS